MAQHRLTVVDGQGTALKTGICSCGRWRKAGYTSHDKTVADWLNNHTIPTRDNKSSRIKKRRVGG